MQGLTKGAAILLSFLLVAPVAPRAAADQTSLVTAEEIDRAIERSVAEDEAAREGIRRLLLREEVQKLAGDLGIETKALDRAVSAVDTLDGAELQEVSAYASQLDDELAGGVTITFSLVALLLLIIIIILLAD